MCTNIRIMIPHIFLCVRTINYFDNNKNLYKNLNHNVDLGLAICSTFLQNHLVT
jgi:hypothetical protein